MSSVNKPPIYKNIVADLTFGNPCLLSPIYDNSLGNVVLTRTAKGKFSFTLNGAFPSGKVVILPFGDFNSSVYPITLGGGQYGGYLQVLQPDLNHFEIWTYDHAGMLADIFYSTCIDLRVYP